MDRILRELTSCENSMATFCASIFIFAAILAISWVMPVEAEITRGCEGSFILTINYKSGDSASKALDMFEGRGSCKSKAYANTCRHNAMSSIFLCGKDLWFQRWNLIGNPKDDHPDVPLPATCRGDTTGARKVGPFKTNPYGKGTDIKYAMEYSTCCEMQPGAGDLELTLKVWSSGDKGCGKDHNNLSGKYFESRTLIDNYKVNCKKLVKQGMCAKRTGG